MPAQTPFNPEDFNVQRGDSYRMVGWSFSFDFSDYDIQLTLVWPEGSLVKTNDDFEYGAVDGAYLAYWRPSTDESRSIPLGRVTEYELVLEYLGERQTVKSGFAIGVYGLSE